MNLTFDDRALVKLSQDLSKAGKEFNGPPLKAAFRKSLQPVKRLAVQGVPVGKKVRIVSRRGQTSRRGISVGGNSQDRGGATRRDIRIRIVNGEGDEAMRGLVGVSKRGVGWRTHLITRANLHRRIPNDFLDRAERLGVPLAVSSLGPSAQAIVKGILRRYSG